MTMHAIQAKLLQNAHKINMQQMTLREIAQLVGESHPQKISHHMNQLEKKGFISINKKTGVVTVERREEDEENSLLISIPVLGHANCGPAAVFAEENFEGYIQVSKRLLQNVKNYFAIRAIGKSMNKARINGKINVEEGDYVIIDADNKNPSNGDYVLSVIDGVANIKRLFWDQKNNQIALMSESTEKIPPIYVHPSDKYLINGVVKIVIKAPQRAYV